MQARLFDVEDLAAQGQDRLEASVAALLCGAACGVALDEVDLALGRIALGAVGEFAGERRRFEHALAARQIASVTRRVARLFGVYGLGDDLARLARIFLKIRLQLFTERLCDDRAHKAVAQSRLGLPFELGVDQLDRHDRDNALAAVVAAELFLVLEQLELFAVVVEQLGQDRLEAVEVGAAFVGVDVVGVRIDLLAVTVVVLHRDLDLIVVRDGVNVQRGVGDAALGVDALDELDDAALIVERLAIFFERTAVFEDDLQPLVEVGELLQSVAERRIIEVERLEDLAVGIEHDLCAASLGVAYARERSLSDAAVEAHLVQLAVLCDLDVQPLGQRVDARHADAVQTARKLISAAAELAARMQLGQHDLDCGFSLFFDDADRDTSAVVGDGHRAVFEDLHFDGVAKARHRLVDGVVHDLKDEVVKSSLVRRADIHAGSLSNGLKTFEHLNVALGIAVLFGHLYLPLARVHAYARARTRL